MVNNVIADRLGEIMPKAALGCCVPEYLSGLEVRQDKILLPIFRIGGAMSQAAVKESQQRAVVNLNQFPLCILSFVNLRSSGANDSCPCRGRTQIFHVGPVFPHYFVPKKSVRRPSHFPPDTHPVSRVGCRIVQIWPKPSIQPAIARFRRCCGACAKKRG